MGLRKISEDLSGCDNVVSGGDSQRGSTVQGLVPVKAQLLRCKADQGILDDSILNASFIREFFGLYPKRDKRQLFNDSLNTTLARTINTSLSTLIVLLCIFILGGDSIRSFAFAMILGVVIGTLSSLFIASPIAYNMMKNKKVVPVTTEE